ncbi:MAG TPA: PfkB family carbohydrate kinase [Candidatus Dormibacteraeota bacterium]|nr:PfkB family carbohydrate kinase [Candidatus Dormibacteraeota bacterium]
MSRACVSRASEHGTVDLTRLAEIVESFADQRVALLADFVADEFQFGEITRVSREAPVLILRHRKTQVLPGGGANAANNLADMGARIFPVSVVGDDAAGDALLDYFRAKRVNTAGILHLRGWATPTKTRFLARWEHTVPQQVLRVDRLPSAPLPQKVHDALRRKLISLLRPGMALLVSDYGLGAVTAELVKDAASSLPNHPLITLDSRNALHDFRGAGITAATPNEAELESLHHTMIGQDRKALERSGRRTLDRLRLRGLVVTRGKDGMALFERGRRPLLLPIFGSDQAIDVTGAGDTVIAALTLALASGATFVEAAHIANIAGGIVVMKRGTATVTSQELLAAIRGEATGSVPQQSIGTHPA